MKAVHHVGYGDPAKATTLTDIERPVPTEKQVLVRVLASSINSGDWRAVYAAPGFVRLISGFRRPRDPALGGDAAGIVEAVGADRTDLQIGDEVYGIRGGALAEYVAGQSFVRKPANLSFEEAGAVPIAGVTALQALQKYGKVRPSQKVLVNGAGGGVGTFAVQIAKALGAEVTAVTSTDKLELARSLGADHVVDYTREDFTTSGQRYDLIVDVGANRSVREMRRALADGGKMVMVGAGRGSVAVLGRIIGGFIRKRLGQPTIFFYAGGPYEEQLATLREMIEAGKVRPVIERTYPLTEVADALRYVATEKARGKVAITVARAPARPPESGAT
jgi:NADPH:quinone reductase-like Zn-dependent oxidoreductase